MPEGQADPSCETTSPPRQFRRDEAYAVIRDYVLEDRHDGVLSERMLAQRLGIGLGPVRSAVERLRSAGLIAVSPNSGLRVPDVTAQEIIDFYEMRLVLEGHIVGELAARLTRGQSERLSEILSAQEHAAGIGDTAQYHLLDLEFHSALVEFHGNGEMIRALSQLRDKMYRLSRRLHRAHPERLDVNAAQHRGIADALRNGDAAQARERMRTHLAWGRQFTLDPGGRLAMPAPDALPAGDKRPAATTETTANGGNGDDRWQGSRRRAGD